MRSLLLVLVMMVMAGCECGPAIGCNEDLDCPSWGRCEKLGNARGSCVLKAVVADAGADAGVDAGIDAGTDAGVVDAGAPVASLSKNEVEIIQAGCGLATTDTVIVSNTGALPLSVAASTGTSPVFSVSPADGTVPPGQSLTFTVTVTVPATTAINTDLRGQLSLTTNDATGQYDVPLRARSSGVTLTLSPAVVSFGVVPVSTSAAPLSLTLTNAGNVEATLTLGAPDDSQFSLQWPGSPMAVTIAPGASLTGLQAGFLPTRTTASSANAQLSVTQPICGVSVTSIPMTGQGTSGVVGLSTTDVFFGNNGRVNCGTQSTSRTFSITNAGNQAFAWTGTLGRGGSSPFTFTPTSGTVPANNGTMLITVSTSAIPAQAGTSEDAFGDVLTISTDVANDVSHPVNLHQTANGAILSFAPSSVAFGQVPVNNTANAPFTVVNAGNTSPLVTLTSDNPKFSITPNGPIAAPGGSGASLTGTYAPGTAVLPESASVQLSLDGAEPLCGPLPAALTMTGQGTSGSVSYSPVALDFGAVNCGTTPAAATVTFRNNGNQAYTVTPVLGRDAGSPYVVTMNPSSGVVVNDGGTVVITVAPNRIPQTSAVTPNLYGDTLTVSTDVLNDPPHDIPLRLTARGSIFAISTQSINFGSVTVGVTATSQFTLSNSGNAPGALSFAAIDPAVFGLPTNASLNAASSSLSSATFSPAAQGSYSDMAMVTTTPSTVLCQPLPFTTLSLAGVGTSGNLVALSTTNLSFGLVPCGTTASPRTFTVTNNSSNPLSFSYTLAGGASSPYTVSGPSTVAAGAMGTVTVTPKLVPATSSTAVNAFGDTLSIVGMGGPVNEMHAVALAQTAQGAVLTVNPTSLSFTDGQTQTFTLSNGGNLAAPFTLTRTGSNRFSLTPTSGNVSGGGSVTNSISYNKQLLDGAQSATVSVTTTAGRCAPLPADIPLSGN